MRAAIFGATTTVLLAAAMAILFFGSFASPVDAGFLDPVEGQSVRDELAKFGALAPAGIDAVGSPDDMLPDLSLVVERADSIDDDQWWRPLRDALLSRPEVEAVAVASADDNTSVLHLRLDNGSVDRSGVADLAAGLVAATEAEMADQGGSTVTVGGLALSDETIINRFATSVRWLAVLALALAAYAIWRLGVRRGLVLAVAWSLSTLAAGRITAQVLDPFDGTVAASPLVGGLAGLLFAVVVGLRVAKWYEQGHTYTDEAGAIQASLAEVASDVILILGSLMAVVGVLWIAGGSSRGVVAVMVGALVGAVFTGAVVGAAMAALGRTSRRSGDILPYSVPSGGQLLVVTVLGLVALLSVLSLFAFRSPSRDLVDYRSLPGDEPARLVGDVLGSGAGDPTEALVSVVDGSNEAATRTWAEAVATLSNVAWVDTIDTRFTGVNSSEVGPAVSLASEDQLGYRADDVAIIVPSVPIRSAEGAALIDDIGRLADERVAIHGGANSLGRGSTLLVIATVILLAAAGAGTVLVETDNNTGLALTSFMLRLLGGAATVGIYRLLSTDASAVETIAALALVAATVSLFELEFLHDRSRQGAMWSQAAGVSSNGSLVGEPSKVLARASLLGAVAMVGAGVWVALSRFVGGGPTVGRFGFALATALIVEIALGFLVLRPALLGEQAAYHAFARPLRSTLHAGQQRRSEPSSVDDPAWRRLVSDLVLAEFSLQTDPGTARVDDVFLEGTPLFRQAGEQNHSLASSGLRVSGRAPQVCRVETFREDPSIMVSVTVDHPERHLVDSSGTVYGVRRPQRRSTMLWLVGIDGGDVRIAESIDMGTVPLDVDRTPDKTPFPEIATVSG